MSTLRRISLAVFLSFPPSCSGLLKVHFKRPVSGTPNITKSRWRHEYLNILLAWIQTSSVIERKYFFLSLILTAIAGVCDSLSLSLSLSLFLSLSLSPSLSLTLSQSLSLFLSLSLSLSLPSLSLSLSLPPLSLSLSPLSLSMMIISSTNPVMNLSLSHRRAFSECCCFGFQK